MKNFIFISCLCLATVVYAGNEKQPSGVAPNQLKLEKRIQEPNIKSIEIGATGIVSREVETKDLQVASPYKPAFLYKTMLNEKELREMAEFMVTEQCDSVVSSVNSTGEKYTKQSFEFYKDTHLPKQRINSMWNTNTNSWDSTEIYNFTWDEDGYCLIQELFYPGENVGMRYVFTYNDQKLGDSQTVYRYDLLVSDDWYVTEKGEYEYDSRGDMTKEIRYVWNGTDWTPYDMTKAAWDDQHRMILNEPYLWQDNKWIGNGDKKEWVFDKNGNKRREALYYWDEETNDWFNWRVIEQTFLGDDAAHPTRILWKNWNKTYQNWSGVEEYYGAVRRNQLTEISYDKQGREISQKASEGFTAAANEEDTEYIVGATEATEWSDIEGGLTQSVRTSILYKTPANSLEEESLINDVTTYRYDLIGRKVYMFSKHINSQLTELADYQTNEWTYENDNLVREYLYTFNSNQASCATYTYDDSHNVLTQTSRYKEGQGNDEENWTNSNHFEYIWDVEHGLLLDKKAYFWNGADWNPNFGEGVTYDFDADMSQINMWIGADTNYKILENRSYMSNDGDWDWIGFKYYYSPVATGIEKQIADTNIKVYPRYVKEELNVEADEEVEVNIYNIQGMLVLTTTDKCINVSHLSTGLYIVEVNGYKTKVVKE